MQLVGVQGAAPAALLAARGRTLGSVWVCVRACTKARGASWEWAGRPDLRTRRARGARSGRFAATKRRGRKKHRKRIEDPSYRRIADGAQGSVGPGPARSWPEIHRPTSWPLGVGTRVYHFTGILVSAACWRHVRLQKESARAHTPSLNTQKTHRLSRCPQPTHQNQPEGAQPPLPATTDDSTRGPQTACTSRPRRPAAGRTDTGVPHSHIPPNKGTAPQRLVRRPTTAVHRMEGRAPPVARLVQRPLVVEVQAL